MKTKKTDITSPVREDAAAHRRSGKYVLKLYVAGATSRSSQAILRARRLCESALKGTYSLEVIDVYQQPLLARSGQIIATPTLVREFPRPMRRFLGSLENTASLFAGLDLGVAPGQSP